MIVKLHESKNGTVVSVVDKELLGEKFEEGDLQLDLSAEFYRGTEKTTEEVGDLIRNAYSVNIIGEKTIKLAIEEGIIVEEMVKRIAGIPYYQGILND